MADSAPDSTAKLTATGGVNEQWLVRWLIAPAVIVMAIVVLAPLLYAFFLSLSHAEIRVVGGRGGVITEFAGLENYLYFLRDPAFWASVRMTLYFTIVSLTVEMVIGLGIALVLNEEFPGRAIVRSLIILPWAVPTVVNARLWGLILEPQPYGALNGILAALHLQGPRDAVNFLSPVPVFQGVPILGEIATWLGATQAIHWIIVADSWKVIPVIALLSLGGLQAIPKEQYEAAEVDGAGAIQRFWSITFPGLRPVLLVILVYRTMELFRVFDILYILMAYAVPVVAIRTFQETFVFGLFGRGSALAFLIGVIIVGLSALYRRMIQVEDEVS